MTDAPGWTPEDVAVAIEHALTTEADGTPRGIDLSPAGPAGPATLYMELDGQQFAITVAEIR